MWQQSPHPILQDDPLELATARNRQALQVCNYLYFCSENESALRHALGRHYLPDYRITDIIRDTHKKLSQLNSDIKEKSDLTLELTRKIYLKKKPPLVSFLPLDPDRLKLDVENQQLIKHMTRAYQELEKYGLC
jgi:hypothetical protein